MKIEDQVCALQFSKRLEELGVKQESLFNWYEGIKEPFVDWHEQGHVCQDYPNPEVLYSAFTVAELGEMLPLMVEYGTLDLFALCEYKSKRKYWKVQYLDLPYKLKKYFSDFNLANAMAKMLIYLIENDLLKSKELLA